MPLGELIFKGNILSTADFRANIFNILQGGSAVRCFLSELGQGQVDAK